MFGRTIKCCIATDNGRTTEFIRRKYYPDKSYCYECGVRVFFIKKNEAMRKQSFELIAKYRRCYDSYIPSSKTSINPVGSALYR